jgi:hypothetical protein
MDRFLFILSVSQFGKKKDSKRDQTFVVVKENQNCSLGDWIDVDRMGR